MTVVNIEVLSRLGLPLTDPARPLTDLEHDKVDLLGNPVRRLEVLVALLGTGHGPRTGRRSWAGGTPARASGPPGSRGARSPSSRPGPWAHAGRNPERPAAPCPS